MPKRYVYYLLLCVLGTLAITHTTLAQSSIADDFTDGNLYLNPTWSGTTGDFALYGGYANLSGVATGGTAWLALPAPVRDSATWGLRLRLDFDPSTQNYLCHYLSADRLDVADPLTQGWYLKVGASGVADGLELWHSRGSSRSKRYTFLPGALARRPSIYYKITRSRTGRWALAADTGGLGRLSPMGSYTDTLPLQGAYAGLLVGYTVSNVVGTHLDDFYVGPLAAPIVPVPEVAPEAAFCAGKQLWLQYAVPLALPDTAPLTLQIDGQPRQARASLAPDGRLLLRFAAFADSLRALQIGLPPGLRAANGSALTTAPVGVRCLATAKVGNLLLTEVKAGAGTADAARVPAAEFVELHNTAAYTIWAQGLTLADATGARRPLVADSLPAGSYTVLCNTGGAQAFARLGVRVLAGPMPLLNDAGDRLELRLADSSLVDSMHYSPTYWQLDADIANLSLERALPGEGCATAITWQPCRSASGATPGAPNANANLPNPALAPKLVSVSYNGSNSLAFAFAPAADTLAAAALPFINSNPALAATAYSWAGGKLVVTLAALPDSATAYSIALLGPKGCGGAQSADTQRIAFGLPRPAATGRVVLNEVLYHPWPGSAAFVELYNPTNRFVSLGGLALASAHGLRLDTTYLPLNAPALAPGGYQLLAADYRKIALAYPEARRAAWLPTRLPSLDVDFGTLALLSPQGTTLEQLTYSEATQNPLLTDPQGVSYERIDPTAPANLAANWQSCAKAAGFATPGYGNSQYMPGNTGTGQGVLVAEPPIFSPNADGQADQVRLVLQNATGSAGQLRIYDSEGRAIRTLATAQTLPSQWATFWDGRTDDGTAAGAGLYIVLAEVYTSGGTTARHKTTVVLAPR